MKLKQITHRLNTAEASVESLYERRFWSQCQRQYTFQPIYKIDGTLMAVELLTVVIHPSEEGMRIAPDRYFSSISTRSRLSVIEEQLQLLEKWQVTFLEYGILASVNVDGPALMAMKHHQPILALIDRLPWVRFELVEHITQPQAATLARLQEFGPLWLDDFGTGMANFSALSEVRYDYIKVARDLFIMLRKSEEGRTLFTGLLQLMNRYCKGVIVEGIETLDEWRDVQASPAFAAQGYYLSRPVPFENLENVLIRLP
ncbi:cyclic-guanylate-specific phosphodiesterase [Enterobacter sp. R1(2018)]|uniref:cyclic-guanylate-specific phosphodiesterase n=1 Tax=Enterobacter sp. R1(2018) TaxID=2447891 RepID=UPI000EAF8BB7|nr:cyclic-guanylate-specific phosphodiesterase [Enterobacter sp. R1(2018)]RKQ41261.1 cyclic-guanylate-specific phosphodiesterase [Enterobacter sp. R1(2018)]